MTDTVRVPRASLYDLLDAANSFCEDGDLLAGEIRNRVKAMLAASPQGEGSSAEWITHDGGPNPVPGKMVEVRYRNGETETRTANRLGWNHWEAETPGLGGYDIIAYRVTEGVK